MMPIEIDLFHDVQIGKGSRSNYHRSNDAVPRRADQSSSSAFQALDSVLPFGVHRARLPSMPPLAPARLHLGFQRVVL